MHEQLKLGGVFRITCRRPDGSIRWTEETKNLVTYQGIQKVLDDVFAGGTDARVLTWYLGLCAASPTPAATDTLASHVGWTEFTSYSGDRKAWTEVRTAQQMTNSAAKATFTLTADGCTIGGAFLCGAATGTSAPLMSVSAFASNKSGDTNDVLEVTYTFSGASA